MPQGGKSKAFIKEADSLDAITIGPSSSHLLTPDAIWAKKEVLKDVLRGAAEPIYPSDGLEAASNVKENLKAQEAPRTIELGPRIIQLFVTTTGNDLLTILVLPEDTIGDLKLKVSEKTGKKFRAQQLSYGGKTLRDELTIKDYNLTENATIMGYFSLTGVRVGR